MSMPLLLHLLQELDARGYRLGRDEDGIHRAEASVNLDDGRSKRPLLNPVDVRSMDAQWPFLKFGRDDGIRRASSVPAIATQFHKSPRANAASRNHDVPANSATEALSRRARRDRF